MTRVPDPMTGFLRTDWIRRGDKPRACAQCGRPLNVGDSYTYVGREEETFCCLGCAARWLARAQS